MTKGIDEFKCDACRLWRSKPMISVVARGVYCKGLPVGFYANYCNDSTKCYQGATEIVEQERRQSLKDSSCSEQEGDTP